MIKLLDSHCHLQYEPLYENLEHCIDEMRAQLNKIICVSTNLNSIDSINKIIDQFSDQDTLMIYSSVGVHPLDVQKYIELDVQKHIDDESVHAELPDHMRHLKMQLENKIAIAKNLIAIGETGLDDFRAPLGQYQIDAFEMQIELGISHNLPIIMHTRCGLNSVVEYECMRIIDKHPEARIIAHCFGGSMEFMQFLAARKHLISFACNIGYKSAQDLRDIASQVPLENLMIETDSPFLPPKNHRGKPNSPVHVREVALVLSEMHKVDYDTFVQQMQDNFDRFFHVKKLLLAERSDCDLIGYI